MSEYAVMPLNDYVDACDSIRGKTQKTENIKSSELPNKINEVYETGKQVGHAEGYNAGYNEGWDNGETQGYENGLSEGEETMLDAMWEAIQGGGQRTTYNSALFDETTFTKKTFKPKYDIRPTGANCYAWTQKAVPDKEKIIAEGQVNMAELEKERGIVFDFSNVTNFSIAFSGGLFSHLSTIDLKSATLLNMAFYGGYLSGSYDDLMIKRIERLICYETNNFANINCFGYQYRLEYIGFEGVVATSIDLGTCPLTVESINKLFACLKDYSTLGGTYTVTLKADRENMLTAEEKAVATNKGWTLVWS